MSYQEIISRIIRKKYHNTYFLHGEEPFFIDAISETIENSVLKPEERDFNQLVLYGKETDYKYVLDFVSRYPMMAQYRVLILKEAQEMKTLKMLQNYVQKPNKQAILVICYKNKRFDGRTSFAKSVKKHAFTYASKKLYDNQLEGWIQNQARLNELSIKPEASLLMAEFLGADLSKIDNELKKLKIISGDQDMVTIDHIKEHISFSKDFNVFELNNAVGRRDVARALRIIQYFGLNQKMNPIQKVIATLYSYFTKIYIVKQNDGASDRELMQKMRMGTAYFVKEYKNAARNYSLVQIKNAFRILAEYDLRAKGVQNRRIESKDLMKEMVYGILH